MEQEIQLLNDKVTAMELNIARMESDSRQQIHNGVDGGLVNFSNLSGLIKTVTVAGELTNILASVPKSVKDQILIDTTTATKKLYIYDNVGYVWRSVTIA